MLDRFECLVPFQQFPQRRWSNIGVTRLHDFLAHTGSCLRTSCDHVNRSWPDPRPLVTVSFSVFPALNVGEVEADIDTASPVLGLRPVRAGRLLVPKVPNPGSRTSSPSASASPVMAYTPSTASLVAPLVSALQAANRVGHLGLVHVLTSRRDPVPFRHPRIAHHSVPDIDYHEGLPAARPGCTGARSFCRRRSADHRGPQAT